jgi:hypothetical protein
MRCTRPSGRSHMRRARTTSSTCPATLSATCPARPALIARTAIRSIFTHQRRMSAGIPRETTGINLGWY